MSLQSVYFNRFKPINGFIFLLILVFLILQNPFAEGFRYDARLYWELTISYIDSGTFSFLHFNEPLRGFLFSFMLLPALFFGKLLHINDIIVCRIYLALIFSACYAYGSGILFRKMFHELMHPIMHALLGFLLLILWWEYFTIPLSDVMGMLVLISAFLLANKKQNILIIASGVLMYGAVNIRPVFLIAVPFYFYLHFSYGKNYKHSLVAIVMAAMGFLLGAIPQFYINRNNFKVNTIFVPTEASKETGGKNLMLMQLNWGLSIQKYETNIGIDYPEPQVRYMDNAGRELSNKHGNKDFESYNEYWSFVIQNPGLLKCYLKHLFNGLDITTPKAYITEGFYNRSLLLKLINFTVLFLGFVGVLLFIYKSKRLAVVMLLIASFITMVAIPTAIEVRYLMLLHVLLYFFACCFVQRIVFKHILPSRRQWVILIVCYTLFVGLSTYKSNINMRNLEFKQQS